MSDGPVIDGRDLLPPEPLERVLAALPALEPHQALTLLLYREPFPLYDVLRRLAVTWQTRLEADGTYVVTMRRAT